MRRRQAGDGRQALSRATGESTRSVDYEDVPVVVGKTLDMLAQVDLLPFTAVAQGKPGRQGHAPTAS